MNKRVGGWCFIEKINKHFIKIPVYWKFLWVAWKRVGLWRILFILSLIVSIGGVRWPLVQLSFSILPRLRHRYPYLIYITWVMYCLYQLPPHSFSFLLLPYKAGGGIFFCTPSVWPDLAVPFVRLYLIIYYK